MSIETCNQIGAHLRAMAATSESAYGYDLTQFANMLVTAESKAMRENSPMVSIGIVSHGAQWLMYAVQNAAYEDEPAERSRAREEVFTALHDALKSVGQPA